MQHEHRTRCICAFALLVLILGLPPAARAQDPVSDGALGLDIFGSAGLSWPAAKNAPVAIDFRSKAVDLGGGVRVTGLGRGLFAQVAVSRWSDSGERAVLGLDGIAVPLGIPLQMKATFLDATLGLRSSLRRSDGRISSIMYVGAGAGFVRYQESPPAVNAIGVDTRKPSYHLLGGVEIPVGGRFAVALDGRYRYVQGDLGNPGTAAVFEEDTLAGFQTSVGLRFGFGGTGQAAPPSIRRDPAADPVPPVEEDPVDGQRPTGMITQSAPVFLMPDSTRTPLRTLPAGMIIRVLDQEGDWVRVQFNDRQYGPRVGYVQRRFVRVRPTP